MGSAGIDLPLLCWERFVFIVKRKKKISFYHQVSNERETLLFFGRFLFFLLQAKNEKSGMKLMCLRCVNQTAARHNRGMGIRTPF
jgi:hypothetical protein